MKNLRSVGLLALLLAAFSISAFAKETPVLDVMNPLAGSSSPAADTITFTVSEKGHMLPKPGQVFSTGDHEGEIMPYLLSSPKAIAYPRWAIRNGWQGDFSIAIEIRTDGTVGQYKVMQSTGHGMLDEAATSAVKSWKFQPAMKDGKPIVTCIQIPIRFQLNQE